MTARLEVLILGIETSCDETSAAVVEDGRRVLSSVVSSQIALHAPYGGVVPEIASRQHVRAIGPIVRQALVESGARDRGVDAVAVTVGPGLAGALLVGANFARGLAQGWNVPLIPVNHLEGHLHSVWLIDRDPPTVSQSPTLPLVALIVSGGHTQLIEVRGHGEYRVLGRTLDDAAGEAFDKVGRLLGLPYPGGPSISRAALGATAPVSLPRALLPGTFNFSFSGLKTATLHAAYATATGRSPNQTRGETLPRVDVASQLSAEQVANLAAGFQQSVVDILVRKTLAAADQVGAAGIAVVGGVAANAELRRRFTAESTLPLTISAPQYSTDNAAMIASAAFYRPKPELEYDIKPDLALVVAAGRNDNES